MAVKGIMRPMRLPSFVRPALGPVLALGLAGALVACGHENDSDRAADVASADHPSPSATATATSGGPAAYPDFPVADYTYRLEVLCFCPVLGPVAVTVADGRIVQAVIAEGDQSGKPAPKFTRLTINDIIAIANDSKPAKVEVTWPSGEDFPSVVRVNQLEHATDDEVTYTIKDVRAR